MTLYYRTTDAAIRDLSAEEFAALAPSKRATLRLYSEDPRPTPSATQYVAPGPVVVDETTARKTWLLVEKTAEQIAADTFQTNSEAEWSQIRQVALALKNGTGTAAERLTRCERVLYRLLKDRFGTEAP